MLIVSSKKDLWKNHGHSKKDIFLDFDLDSELAVDDTAYAKITKKTFKKRIKSKRILVLIHGYNPDFLDVLASYSTLHQNIQQQLANDNYDEVIGYTWHVGTKEDSDYKDAKKDAVIASEKLQTLLKTLEKADSIDVITHSLGSRVLLRALATKKQKKSKKQNKKKDAGLTIRHHFCVAPAVSNTCFQKGNRLRKATKQTEATWIFYSRNDSSLQSSDLLAKSNVAMGLTGPICKSRKVKKSKRVNNFPKNTVTINSTSLVHTHGTYKRLPAFYNCLESIIKNDSSISGKELVLEHYVGNTHTSSKL